MVQIGGDARDKDSPKQAERQWTLTAPGDQHHDDRGQKQKGEFHRLVPAEKDAPVYDRFADLLNANPVRQDP